VSVCAHPCRRPSVSSSRLPGLPLQMDTVLPPSFNVSISRIQNFAHNISIPMDKDKK
jgi:hypothetical protein